jgi:hypothetical protein
MFHKTYFGVDGGDGGPLQEPVETPPPYESGVWTSLIKDPEERRVKRLKATDSYIQVSDSPSDGCASVGLNRTLLSKDYKARTGGLVRMETDAFTTMEETDIGNTVILTGGGAFQIRNCHFADGDYIFGRPADGRGCEFTVINLGLFLVEIKSVIGTSSVELWFKGPERWLVPNGQIRCTQISSYQTYVSGDLSLP